MTTVSLNRETRGYWDYIKNASSQSKLALITLLSSSLSDSQEVKAVRPNPLKASRRSRMTDEEMELAMQGEATAIGSNDEAMPADIINENKGRIVKGLEKWL